MTNDIIELEKVILGSLMLSYDLVYTDGYFKLNEHVFSDKNNKEVFKAIQLTVDENIQVDLLVITQRLRVMKSKVSAMYLADLTTRIGSVANFEQHCYILFQIYMKREVGEIARQMHSISIDDSVDALEAVAELLKKAEDLVSNDILSKDDTLDTILEKTKDEILSREGSGVAGLSTGIPELDKWTLGFEFGGLTIIGGRPGVGKTTSALSICKNISILNDTKVAFFSLEMKAPQILSKLICLTGNLKTSNVARGKLDDKEKEILEKSVSKIKKGSFQIYDNYFTINQIVSKARALHMKGQLDCVFIDYLQLIEGTRERNGNREQEISGISRRLKRLAMQLNIPVIALSQLKRDAEGRPPKLSDLRESGSLEQDASLVLFTYRDELPDETGQVNLDECILICAKNRNANPRDIKLYYRHDTSQEWCDPSEANNNFIEEKKDDFFPTSITQTSNNF
jgi:replicative DNA helicase